MLSVKVATIDGEFADSERDLIRQYFSTEWGYDLEFVDAGLSEIEKASNDHSVKQVALKLAEFKKGNPDCNYSSMSKEIVRFLTEVSEADGIIDEREEMAVERVKRIFDEVGTFSLTKVAKDGLNLAVESSKKGVETISSGAESVGETFKTVSVSVASGIKKKPQKNS
jgi:tellurite resistance protein